jgi:uncharacterized protein (TIGR03643 family)
MKLELTDALTSTIIAWAWSDDVSFDQIKKDTGYTESEVKAIMRKNLKAKSFIIWRERVQGRKAKHEKRSKLLNIEIE